MHRIGLVSVSFRQCTPKKILELAAASGLEAIEWGSDIHAPANDIKALSNIAEMQKEYKISCSSYGTYFRLGATPLDELPQSINAAKILGTDILRLWCGAKGSADYSEAEMYELLSVCKAAAKTAEKFNVKLCMECHNGTVTDTARSALELMERVNSPNFKMYWQPNQYRSLEENCDYAEKLSRYTEHLHIFNWQGDNRYPLRDGAAAWKKYLSYFGENKTLLLEFMPDDKPESLPTEAKALKEIVKEC